MFARAASVLAAAILLIPPGIAAAGTIKHSSVVSANPVEQHPPRARRHRQRHRAGREHRDHRRLVRRGARRRRADDPRTRQHVRLRPGHRPVLPGFTPTCDGPVHGPGRRRGRHRLCRRRLLLDRRRAGAGLARLRLSDGSPVPGFAPADRRWHGHQPGPARRPTSTWAATSPGPAPFPYGARPAGRRHRRRRTPASRSRRAASLTGQVPRSTPWPLTTDRLAGRRQFHHPRRTSRPQLGLIDVDRPPAKVAGWRTDAYAGKCKDDFP